MDCVDVCPVNCFYEGQNMLVIHPDECINCSACELECPVDAIQPDTDPGLEKWTKLNAEYVSKWPNITLRREPPLDAKEFKGVMNKFQEFFSPEPGDGDRPQERGTMFEEPYVPRFVTCCAAAA